MFVNDTAIEFFENEMILAKINAEEDTAVAQMHHVSAYPTMVLLNPDGTEIDRIVGYLPATPLVTTLKEYRQGIGTLDDLLSRADTMQNRDLYMEIATKYKYRGAPEKAGEWYAEVVEAGDPTDSLSGEARMALADMNRRAKDYDAAIADYISVEEDFVGSMFSEAAAIWTAIAYRQKGDTDQAIASFQRFLTEYPNSDDTSYAKTQIEKLKNPDTTSEGH